MHWKTSGNYLKHKNDRYKWYIGNQTLLIFNV